MAFDPAGFDLADLAFPLIGTGPAGFVLADLAFLGLSADPGRVFGTWACPAGGRVWRVPAAGRAWACPAGGRVWRAGAMTFAGVIEKTPGDRVWAVFDLGNVPELRDAAVTIAAQGVSVAAPVTATGTALVGTHKVGAWYAGGVDGVDYEVTCTVTLSDTTVIVRTGTLRVAAKST